MERLETRGVSLWEGMRQGPPSFLQRAAKPGVVESRQVLIFFIPWWLLNFLTPDWLTAIGTISAVLVALALALWGPSFAQLFYHPELRLEAKVQRPAADLVRRRGIGRDGAHVVDLGECYYFRL